MSSTPLAPHVLADATSLCAKVVDEVRRVYIGSREIPEQMLIALLARGHVLLEGVPGVAKTTLVKVFASTLGCSFRRVQFTPDLLPADITGTYVLNPRDGTFGLREGPVFTNILLGDEINRAPAKTQSALLEAMQETQVTIEGETRSLPNPYMVLATQNPVEQAGTYPLPEAQIDRFLMRIVVGYPSATDEQAMLRRFLGAQPAPNKVLDAATVLRLQQLTALIHVEEELLEYAVRLAVHTRQHPKLALGASPRAALALVSAARAKALLSGRAYVIPDDVKGLSSTILAHRLILTAEAELEGVQREDIVRQMLAEVAHRKMAS